MRNSKTINFAVYTQRIKRVRADRGTNDLDETNGNIQNDGFTNSLDSVIYNYPFSVNNTRSVYPSNLSPVRVKIYIETSTTFKYSTNSGYSYNFTNLNISDYLFSNLIKAPQFQKALYYHLVIKHPSLLYSLWIYKGEQ